MAAGFCWYLGAQCCPAWLSAWPLAPGFLDFRPKVTGVWRLSFLGRRIHSVGTQARAVEKPS